MIRLAALAAVVMLAVVAVPLSTASAPTRIEYDLEDVSFPDPYLTSACETDVEITINGKFTIALFSKRGVVTHEEDTLTGTITYSAGSNAVTQPLSAVSRARYPEGATEGAPASVVVTGKGGGSIVGGPPGSGHVKFDAEIVFVDVDGAPVTVPVGELELKGNFDGMTTRVCDALT
jgi:hypothetical protein